MSTQSIGFWEGIFHVAEGRGEFRLIIQPVVAIILGARLGIADAKEGKGPFLLRVFRTPQRRTILKDAASDVMVPFLVAVVIDSILQHYALGMVRPLAAVIVGAVLIWLPFAISRALTNRIFVRSHRGQPTPTPPAPR